MAYVILLEYISRLCIQQLRSNPNMETIFGIIDGGNNDQIARIVIEKLNDFFQKQVTEL